MASEKLYESFCQKTTFKKTARHYNSRYFSDLKNIFKKICHDHAGSVLCLLLFCLSFCRKCFRTPRPPKSFRKFFFVSFHDLHVAAFLTRFTKIYKDFGIHQRLFEETSLKASILPRRSGQSPLQYAAAFSPEMPFKGAVG